MNRPTDVTDPSAYLQSLSALAPTLPQLHAFHGQAEAVAVVDVPHHNPHHHHEPPHHGLAHSEDAFGVAVTAAEPPKKPSTKKVPLTIHEALTYAPRGIYYDFSTDQLKCSCNRKPCDGWASYAFTRHFGLACHKRYEEERLNDMEKARLREMRLAYIRKYPIVYEVNNLVKKKRKKKVVKEKEKVLKVGEKRVQERHWMEMWRDAKNELKQLRQDLKEEEDPEVRSELMLDIEGLKKRKREWGSMLGLDKPVTRQSM